MASWLHRTTKVYLNSFGDVDSLPDPIGDYIKNPDLSSVTGWANKYWKITGDIVSLMNQSERDAVDAAREAQRVTNNRAVAVAIPDNLLESIGFYVRELIEVFNKRDNYLVNHIAELQSALDDVKASSGAAQSIRDAIPASWLATNTRTRAQAIQDYKDDINAGGADS